MTSFYAMHSTCPDTLEPTLRTSSCERLEELLDLRNQTPAKKAEIDRAIVEEFEATRSILVLDMAGFSFSVRRNGIIHHLALIRRMHRIVSRVIHDVGGGVVKFEADNCFAVFNSPSLALQAAIKINQSLEAENNEPGQEDRIDVSIGIGFGKILLGCDDFFGDEVNLACKLGEDVAGHGEILLTEMAHQSLSAADKKASFQSLQLTVSGIHISGYKCLYR